MARSSLRVLVIDDDPVHRRLVKAALTNAEWDVELVEAGDAQEGVRLGLAQAYDVVLLDYSLPDSDGLFVLRQLRARGVPSPIIAMTGAGSQEVAVQFMKGGATDYIVKGEGGPVRLAHTVRSAVGTYRLAGELRRLRDLAAHRERLALVGALSNTALEGFGQGVEGLSALLAPHWSKLPADVGTEGQALLTGLGELRDTLVMLRALLAEDDAGGSAPFDDEAAKTLGLYRRLAPGEVHIEDHLGFGGRARMGPRAARQILAHLLNNAIEALVEGGRIVVTTQPVDGDLLLTVEDNGPGLPPDLEARAFELFVTTKEGHEGIGLTLVRHLVEKQGGTVTAGPRPGGGARFQVRIPAELA